MLQKLEEPDTSHKLTQVDIGALTDLVALYGKAKAAEIVGYTAQNTLQAAIDRGTATGSVIAAAKLALELHDSKEYAETLEAELSAPKAETNLAVISYGPEKAEAVEGVVKALGVEMMKVSL